MGIQLLDSTCIVTKVRLPGDCVSTKRTNNHECNIDTDRERGEFLHILSMEYASYILCPTH